MRTRKLLLCAVMGGVLWAVPALAVSVDVPVTEPSEVGQAHTFKAVVMDAVGTVQYEWKFSESEDFQPGAADMPHTYLTPGHTSVDVRVTDGAGDSAVASFQHLVHYPLTPRRPTSSNAIVYDKARNRVYVVNQDNDSVTSIDADQMKKVAELAVYRHPESLAMTAEGKLWVVNKDDYAVAIIDPDRFVIEKGFRLPYASQPMGIAMSPTGDAAYITLMALGKLLKLNPKTGEVLGDVLVGPSARGLSVSHDGKAVYVTRFISSDAAGEVVQVDAPTMKVISRIALAADTTTADSDQAARGVPNYLFSVGLTPDGRQAWVTGKKDNIFRGSIRDGQVLTQENTVRPLVSVIDVASARELEPSRIDLDDRSLPSHVEFSPYGDFAIITLVGSNRVEVRDCFKTTSVFSALGDVGAAPRGTVVGPQSRVFVQGSLSRNVLVFDMSALFGSFDKGTPPQLADIPTVAQEKLPADILLGKKIFHNSADVRMTSQGYLSCGTCHFEGMDDGRVFDFSSRGEGFRNTPALLGRKGTGQGRLNWSANFDEVQDFETQIRELFIGRGFMANDVLAVGTRKDPLGDPKAGLSKDLDALAAYVSTLDHVNPSPFRNPDGTLTGDGQAGKALFEKLGCGFCHAGAELTDSGRGMLHDVGTITPKSGMRAGGPLEGIDTPTLLGVWETAPYLHDGSAATLRDVLTTRNPNDLHGFVSSLRPAQIDQLVAYLQQIDNELPPRRLSFEPPVPDGGAHQGPGGVAGTGVTGVTGDHQQGCACAVSAAPVGLELGALSLWAAVLLMVRNWRSRTSRTGGRR